MNIYAQFKTVDIQPQHVDVHAGTTNSKNIRPTLWEQKDGILHGHCSAFFGHICYLMPLFTGCHIFPLTFLRS